MTEVKKVVVFSWEIVTGYIHEWKVVGEYIVDKETDSAFHIKGFWNGGWRDKKIYKYETIN